MSSSRRLNGPSLAFIIRGKPLITTPAATAASRAAVTGRPALFGPSPEMSTTWRIPSKPLPSKAATAKSIAPEIEVPTAAEIRPSASPSAKACAEAAPSSRVQPLSMPRRPGPAHSK